MQHPNENVSSQSSRYDKVVWTTEMERVFIELMHEEFISHRLQSSTFPPWVWSRITEKMNSVMSQQGCLFTTVQLKGKLSRLRRAWRLLNDMITKGTGWGWDSERNTITDDAGRLEELYQQNPEYKKLLSMGFHALSYALRCSHETRRWWLARSSSQPRRRSIHSTHDIDEEQMEGTQSGSRRSRDELNESLQGKIDRSGPKATESIERPTFYNMASPREEGGPEANSTSESSGTPGTPETPGSNESDVPEEFLAFRDLICPELFLENVPLDALTSRGLLPHGRTSRVSSIEEVALFMQTVGMHKRQRDNMERFQHSLETINRRFHRVLSALIASELWTARWYRHGSPVWTKIDIDREKGGLAQNVLAICDFDMNFTYVYAGWERSAADARVLDHAVSHDNTFPFPPIDTAYRRYLEIAGFPQDLHWTLNVEQRFMWMIVDDNTRAPMRDNALAEAQMGHWARGLRRHFEYPYTRDQFHAITQLPGIFYDIEIFVMVFPLELRPRASRYYPLASRYYQYPEPYYPSMLEVWGPIRLPGVPVEDQGAAEDNESINSLRSPVRGGVDAPIVISDSAAPSVQTHTHIASWDAVEHVARGDGGSQMAHSTSFAARCSLDMGSEVGRIGSWTDYICHFGVQSDRGAHTNSDGDSTTRSRRPQGLPPRSRDGP
ncbi:UNVERIFIED_CONTAM: hypothetical protein Sangu_1971200 [Sesamum angustifolium]|uniref:Myb/SANT-like domain-containing protein n=1 Tax=Sesamum angustifolium TaxID=2727405 RepID=A0AAW2LWQ1_9LAMI